MNVTADTRDEIRRFWQRDGDEYDRGAGHGVFSEDETDRWLGFVGGVPVPSDALDVGTGTGFCSTLLAGLGHRVVGVDWSQDMLSTARRKATAAGLDIRFEVAEAENLPFEDETFDLVTARHVLWTLLDPARALREWRRVLKPGGLLVVDLSLGRRGAHYSDEVEEALPLSLVESEAPLLDLIAAAGFTATTHQVVERTGHEEKTHTSAVVHATR